MRESERTYARKLGLWLAPSTPWPSPRAALSDVLAGAPAATAWPARDAVGRIAWHVPDHTWELEDRRPAAGA